MCIVDSVSEYRQNLSAILPHAIDDVMVLSICYVYQVLRRNKNLQDWKSVYPRIKGSTNYSFFVRAKIISSQFSMDSPFNKDCPFTPFHTERPNYGAQAGPIQAVPWPESAASPPGIPPQIHTWFQVLLTFLYCNLYCRQTLYESSYLTQ